MTKIPSTLSDSASLEQHFRRPQLLLFVLSALIFIVYAVSLSFGFVWDDVFQIADNPMIRSWSNLPRVFASDLWVHVQVGQLYYRPVFTTWSILNYSVFQLNPWGWHLTAVLLHIAAAWVVYFLARNLALSYWTSAMAAALFAFHPIHIECVAWISAASDTMVTVFYLLAFIAFLKSREPSSVQHGSWRIASISLLAFALLTKEMAVTFAGLVALYAWLFPSAGAGKNFKGRFREAFLATLPYAGVTLAYLVLRKYALHVLVSPITVHRTTAEYAMTLPYVLAFYLRLLLAPVGLTGLYYTPFLAPDQFWVFAASVAALALFSGLIWFWYRRTGDRMVVFLGLWPLLTLIPALYLPNFTSGDIVRDRYAYLPSVGFLLLGAKAIRLLPGVGKITPRTAQTAFCGTVLLAYIAGCSQEIYWASELSLFRRGHDLYPDNTYASVGLARLLQRNGDTDKAIALLQQAIHQNPANWKAQKLLAEAYSRVGDQENGRRALTRAIALNPDIFSGETDTADIAGLYGRLGDYNQALQLCAGVLAKAPDLPSALYNCGNINFQLGRYGEAEQLLARAVRASPGDPDSIYWLGRVFLQTGHVAQAQAAFGKVLETRPDVSEYHYRLGESLEAAGDVASARRQYQEALQLSPNDSQTKRRLADLDHSGK